MSRILISAAHKSSGKTTLSIGLCAALSQRGINVAPFKKGPDYIDPMWLSRASNHDCLNLDFYTMSQNEITAKVVNTEAQNHVSVIEGNKGLYDGLDLDGSNSNAALAKLLQAPVILVIDVQGMTRGIAPLILGYQAFDKDINIAGIILNKYRGERHEQKLQSVIEHYTDVPIIGAVKYNSALQITERHLGLIPSNENRAADAKIKTIANIIADQVDLDILQNIAASASTLPTVSINETPFKLTHQLKIGIAQDEAFGFYYPDDLAAFEHAGATIIPINTLTDTSLPDIDGLFIGGGFPETQLEKLEANTSLRTQIHTAIENGLPTYAECGGLMYLARSINWQGKTHNMVGIIPADCTMHERPQGRGYVQLQHTAASPWPATNSDALIPAHEFHYSGITNIDSQLAYAYQVKRGTGIDGKHDGIVYKNLLANYTHLRDTSRYHWVAHFLKFIESRLIHSK